MVQFLAAISHHLSEILIEEKLSRLPGNSVQLASLLPYFT